MKAREARQRRVLAWIRRLYGIAVSLAVALYFAVGGLLYTLVGAIGDAASRGRAGRLRGRRAVSAGFRSFLRLWQLSGSVAIDTSALDALRGQSRLILAPNHPSSLDAVFIMARVPEVACVLKAGLMRNVFIGGGARWSGHISNDLGAGIVRQAAAELAEGGQVLVFPEGTRTRPDADGVNAFKGAFALIARAAQAPVQSIILHYNTRLLGKGWPLLKIPDYPLVFRAELGRCFDPPPPDGDLRAWMSELEDYYRRVASKREPASGR
ncbi:MAG: lysophospholipid acyltransferase family protein [Verrucomicrobiales bacterium]